MIGDKASYFQRLVYWCATVQSWLLDVLRPHMWVLKGREATSKNKLAVLYAGSELHKNYLMRLAFGSSCEESYLGKKWLWELSKTKRQGEHGCSLLVTEVFQPLSILFRKKNCFYIPSWVVGEVDLLDTDFQFSKNDSLRSDIRRIRKNKLNFIVTNELRHFQVFYYNMYVPYITRVHGNTALIFNYHYMVHAFKHCSLLLVKKEKDYVAGILIRCSRNGAKLWTLGVKDGDANYIHDGAIAALLYFSVLYLKKRGYEKVCFGASRAFLKDGVLRYKKKWNQKLVNTYKRGFLVKPVLRTAGLQAFLLNNPFIFLDKGKFNGALFVENTQVSTKEDSEKTLKQYWLPGMSKLFVYQFGQQRSETLKTAAAQFSDTIAFRSAESLF